EYDIGIMAQWTAPDETSQHVAWARGLADALRPYSSSRYLLNFLGEEGDDTIHAAFGENYPRLAELKRKYDQANFFRINQNIRRAACPHRPLHRAVDKERPRLGRPGHLDQVPIGIAEVDREDGPRGAIARPRTLDGREAEPAHAVDDTSQWLVGEQAE